MLTRVGNGFLALGAGLVVAGLVLGNYFLVLAGTLPLFVVLGAVGLDPPSGIEVARTLDARRVAVGADVRVRVRVRAARGRGLLEVECPVPEVFALQEGNNLHLLRKGAKPLDASFEFTMRCTKRGAWELAPVRYEAVHAFGVQASVRGEAGPMVPLEVRPRLGELRRVRDLPGYARHYFPHGDLARTGTRTTEFRELRQYAHGDPPRAINWKATARRQMRLPPAARVGLAATPLVNEYEHEGRKTVWLFVDAAEYMEVGSDLHNALEHAVEAAGGIAKFYLDRGYRLGAYIYNGQDQLLHPDTGTGQLLKLHQVLTAVKATPARQGLVQAVERCRGFLAEEKPLVVVVTRATEDTDNLVAAVRRVRSLAGFRRRRIPVLVLSPAVYGLLATEGPAFAGAAALLRRLDRRAIARVRALGAAVVEWDPRQHPFASAMLWGMAR